jgi:hypothetical protein
MKVSVVALHGCGFLSTLAVFWSFVWCVPLMGMAHTTLNRRGYRPATFVVDRVVYQAASPTSEGMDLDRFWAEGTVEGVQEKLSLQGFVPKTPTSQEQLEALVKPGQSFSVLYNPDATQVMVQTEYLRVIRHDPDFEHAQPRRLAAWALLAYGPLLFFLLLAIPFWWSVEWRHRRLAFLWLGFDLVGLAVEACGGVLFLMLPTLERLHH